MDLAARLWRVPAERMKANREHLVPLSDGALGLLTTAEVFRSGQAGEPVFPGKSRRPLSDMTLTKVLRDMGHARITVHDFRSSFRDWASEQTDYSGDVVDAALAHTIRNKMEAAYRRTNYLEKRQVLMMDWADFCA